MATCFPSIPPRLDPNVLGERWYDVWMDRVKGSGLWLEDWMRHQHRDAFYKHGSVCENYDQIQAAVYAVGGWADGYSNAVFRMLENLKAPAKGLVGPWAISIPILPSRVRQSGFCRSVCAGGITG